MTDLANCPFCGDAPVIRRTMQDYPADDVHPAGQYEAAVHVCCVTCGFELVEECQSEVIAAWNRRATTRTSEAEPVACADCGAKDPFMYPCHQQGCPHSPTPASDDQVEAVRDVISYLEWVHRQGGLGYRIHDKLEKCISALAAMGSTKPAPRLDATVRSGEEG